MDLVNLSRVCDSSSGLSELKSKIESVSDIYQLYEEDGLLVVDEDHLLIPSSWSKDEASDKLESYRERIRSILSKAGYEEVDDESKHDSHYYYYSKKVKDSSDDEILKFESPSEEEMAKVDKETKVFIEKNINAIANCIRKWPDGTIVIPTASFLKELKSQLQNDGYDVYSFSQFEVFKK